LCLVAHFGDGDQQRGGEEGFEHQSGMNPCRSGRPAGSAA
jgi:hypothetical protein